MHTNPEGAPFYVHDTSSIVTDVPLHLPELCQRVDWSVKSIQNLVETLGVTLPLNYEIYVGIDCEVVSEELHCYYYMVDHDTQTEFWLNENELSDLGFSRVVSEMHLSK